MTSTMERKYLMKLTKLTILVICGSLALTACGRSAKASTNISTSTTGQELIDLKTAHDAGAISKKEYEQKRQHILNKKT